MQKIFSIFFSTLGVWKTPAGAHGNGNGANVSLPVTGTRTADTAQALRTRIERAHFSASRAVARARESIERASGTRGGGEGGIPRRRRRGEVDHHHTVRVCAVQINATGAIVGAV